MVIATAQLTDDTKGQGTGHGRGLRPEAGADPLNTTAFKLSVDLVIGPDVKFDVHIHRGTISRLPNGRVINVGSLMAEQPAGKE